MKKILLVFNGTNYAGYLSVFAIKLAKQSSALLHAVFISPTAQQMIQYPFPNEVPFVAGPLITTEEMQSEYRKSVQTNMETFKTSCETENIRFVVDPDIEITLSELIDHSGFADLMLCSSKEEFGAYSFRELLADAHCPVLLVSENSVIPQKAVLCYDESFSSIYAIKMYSYLFPEWNELPTSVISINLKKNDGNKYDDYISDWLPQHFSNFQKHSLEGNLHNELLRFIKDGDKHSIVIMGAFGRNAISRLFHKSLANVVLEKTSASVFIVHE